MHTHRHTDASFACVCVCACVFVCVCVGVCVGLCVCVCFFNGVALYPDGWAILLLSHSKFPRLRSQSLQ